MITRILMSPWDNSYQLIILPLTEGSIPSDNYEYEVFNAHYLDSLFYQSVD